MDHSGNKIDGTVTQLLMHTKDLLHTLEQWAYGNASEEQVSDVYVRLGNEFNLACRCFVEANIDITDLGDVPAQLRQVLERALSETANQRTLDNYLPNIREIVVTLLRQLKHKQTVLRQNSPRTSHNRAASNASTASAHSNRSKRATNNPASTSTTPTSAETPMPPNQSPMRQPNEKKEQIAQHTPQPQPQPQIHLQPPGPQEAPEKQDPLSQLQKSQALERRASKRYSSYHMVKIMNGDQTTSLPTSAHHATHQADFTESNVVEDRSERSRAARRAQTQAMQPVPEISPQLPQQETLQKEDSNSSKSTVFLRLGQRVRKGYLSAPYSLAAVRLQFVDLFGFTPKAGDVFPDLMIQDHDTGVEYELTEATLQDIRRGSLLTLCVKTDEDAAVDAQIKELVQAVQDLSVKVDTKLGINSKGTPTIGSARFKVPAGSHSSGSTTNVSEKAQPASAPKILADNTDSFRQEFAIMRQLCNKTISSMRQDVKKLQAQVTDIKTANSGTNRGYMTASHKKLTEDTQKLISGVDDLQDLVESQRKDVASRGVRLSQKQIDNTGKSIAKAGTELRELQQYITKENPTWVKTWETELNTVVEEQQFFKLQEQLVTDLEADLVNARKTFELVEQCALELSKGDIKRNPVVVHTPNEDPQEAKHELLGEIVALKPNHAERAEAIEKAERLRKRELEMRSDDFKRELGDFVEEGKLQKTGGLEEVERRRKERDEMMREEQRRTDSEAQRHKEVAKEERRRKREEERARQTDIHTGSPPAQS